MLTTPTARASKLIRASSSWVPLAPLPETPPLKIIVPVPVPMPFSYQVSMKLLLNEILCGVIKLDG